MSEHLAFPRETLLVAPILDGDVVSVRWRCDEWPSVTCQMNSANETRLLGGQWMHFACNIERCRSRLRTIPDSALIGTVWSHRLLVRFNWLAYDCTTFEHYAKEVCLLPTPTPQRLEAGQRDCVFKQANVLARPHRESC